MRLWRRALLLLSAARGKELALCQNGFDFGNNTGHGYSRHDPAIVARMRATARVEFVLGQKRSGTVHVQRGPTKGGFSAGSLTLINLRELRLHQRKPKPQLGRLGKLRFVS